MITPALNGMPNVFTARSSNQPATLMKPGTRPKSTNTMMAMLTAKAISDLVAFRFFHFL